MIPIREPILTSRSGTTITVAFLVGGVRAASHRFAERRGDIGRLVALLADDDVEFDNLTVAHGTHGLLRVVAYDGRLMDEHVLVRVVTVDEAVAVLNVEPFHHTDDLGS